MAPTDAAPGPGLGSSSLADALRASLGEEASCVDAAARDDADPLVRADLADDIGAADKADPSSSPELKSRVVREASAEAEQIIARLFTAAGWAGAAEPSPSPSQTFAIRLADGTIVAIEEGVPIVIGRDPDASNVIVAYREVSRAHLRLEQRDGTVHAADVGSSNGTRLHRGTDLHQLVPGISVEVFPGDRMDVLDGIDLCLVIDTGVIDRGVGDRDRTQ